MTNKYTDEQVEYLIKAVQTSFIGLMSYVVQPSEIKLLINFTTVENVITNSAGILKIGLEAVGSCPTPEEMFEDDLGESLQFFNEEAGRGNKENDIDPVDLDDTLWNLE